MKAVDLITYAFAIGIIVFSGLYLNLKDESETTITYLLHTQKVLTEEIEDYKQVNWDSCILYNPEAKFGLRGIYHTPDYYCVWTKGRSLEAINKTECHEVCHDLIYKDYEHFCEGK